jgi:hypothetical protein
MAAAQQRPRRPRTSTRSASQRTSAGGFICSPQKNRVSAVNIIGRLYVVPVFWVTVSVTLGEEMMTNVTREVADGEEHAVGTALHLL